MVSAKSGTLKKRRRTTLGGGGRHLSTRTTPSVEVRVIMETVLMETNRMVGRKLGSVESRVERDEVEVLFKG